MLFKYFLFVCITSNVSNSSDLAVPYNGFTEEIFTAYWSQGAKKSMLNFNVLSKDFFNLHFQQSFAANLPHRFLYFLVMFWWDEQLVRLLVPNSKPILPTTYGFNRSAIPKYAIIATQTPIWDHFSKITKKRKKGLHFLL